MSDGAGSFDELWRLNSSLANKNRKIRVDTLSSQKKIKAIKSLKSGKLPALKN
jgi:hypothetical protein